MPAFTPNRNLYKPGGGSSGLITPDETADIDRINGNMDILDEWSGTIDERTAVTGTRRFRGTAFNFTGTEAPVDWNGTGVNSGDFSHASGILTCVRPGRYLISAQVMMSAGAAVSGIAIIRKNGAGVAQSIAIRSSSGPVPVTVQTIEDFTAGQTFQIGIITTGTVAGDATSDRTYLLYNRL